MSKLNYISKIRIGLFLLFSLILLRPGIAQVAPDWTDFTKRHLYYPHDQYFTGLISRFHSSDNDSEFDEESLTKSSQRALAESIYLKMISNTENVLLNENGDSKELFSQKVITQASLETSGVKSEVYYDNERQMVHAFSYIRKSTVRDAYLRKYNNLNGEITVKKKYVEENIKDLKASLQYVRLLESLKSVRDFVLQSGLETTMKPLNGTLQLEEELLAATARIDKLESQYYGSIKKAVVDLVQVLIHKMDKSIEIKETVLRHVSYKNSTIATEFSDLVHTYLKSTLSAQDMHVLSPYFSSDSMDTAYEISGNYMPLPKGILLSISIVNKHGLTISTAEVVISNDSEDLIAIDYKPKFKDLLVNSSLLNGTSVKGSGLISELWAQKGNQTNIYREGELLSLYVNVSAPSFIRLINISDSLNVLLLDDYYIDKSETNRKIKLPFEWVTECPCGTEFIYLQADVQLHASLKTRKVGNLSLIEDDLDKIINLDKEVVDADFRLKGADVLTITTLPIR